MKCSWHTRGSVTSYTLLLMLLILLMLMLTLLLGTKWGLQRGTLLPMVLTLLMLFVVVVVGRTMGSTTMIFFVPFLAFLRVLLLLMGLK